MSQQKEYTQANKPNNPIVKAAIKKGLTNFKITWHKSLSRSGRGWVLECDQVKWRRIGADQQLAIKSINDLQL
jgi:hypothetical protein